MRRLQFIAARATFREIGERTNTHPESVRRYLTYGHPSVEFVAAFCRTFGASADWILNGLGRPGRATTVEITPTPPRPPSRARGLRRSAPETSDGNGVPS